MNKKELDILEKAFEAQIASAFNKKLFPVIQTKSKTASKLCDEGFLEDVVINHMNVKIRGYALTIKGTLAYCSSDRCAYAYADEDFY